MVVTENYIFVYYLGFLCESSIYNTDSPSESATLTTEFLKDVQTSLTPSETEMITIATSSMCYHFSSSPFNYSQPTNDLFTESFNGTRTGTGINGLLSHFCTFPDPLGGALYNILSVYCSWSHPTVHAPSLSRSSFV